MTIYKPTWLMIKIHRKTGLKYFCKTSRKDPIKYKGSGEYWLRHLKEHGKDIETIWCKLFDNEEDLREFALFVSEVLNIVESVNSQGRKEWANLIPENGMDGGVSAPRTKETVEKMKANQPKKFGTENSFYGKTHSEETRKKCGDSNRGRDTKTQEGKASISNAMKERWADPIRRENQIKALNSRKGEVRSKRAKEVYSHAAKKRNDNMSPEERSLRSKKGGETKKIKYAGLKRQRYTDDNGKVKYRWVSATD